MKRTLEALYAHTRQEGECRVWLGRFKDGSPQLKTEDGVRMVRRLVFEFGGEAIAPKTHPVPMCRNPRCIEREHLKLLSLGEIGKLAVSEGKIATAARTKKITDTRRAQSQFGWPAVEAVRTAPDGMVQKTADKHGMSKAMAVKIRMGRAWQRDPPKITIAPRPLGRYEVVVPPGGGAITEDWFARRQGVEIPSRLNGAYK